MCYCVNNMLKEVIRALRMPVYTIAALLLMAAYIFAYYDYVETMSASPHVSVTQAAR
jgi:hypothetical protein